VTPKGISKDLRHDLWLKASRREKAYRDIFSTLMKGFSHNHNGVSGALRLRIASDGCKDDIL
jgi:hypothetical protein